MPRYGGRHTRIRALTVRAAYGTGCIRCGGLMLPGTRIELDHSDDGRRYLGYSHEYCNRAAGALRKAALARKRRSL